MPYCSEYNPVYNPSLTELPLDQVSPVIPKFNPSIFEWLEDSGRFIEWTPEEIERDKIPLLAPEAEWDALVITDGAEGDDDLFLDDEER